MNEQLKLNDKLSKRFKTGLKKYNLTIDDIKKNWFYIGGESKLHQNHFKRYYNEEPPDHENF